MYNLRAHRRILKFVASANLQVPANPDALVINANSSGESGNADLNLQDLSEFTGVVQCDGAGTLTLEQGFFTKDGIAWMTKDTIAVTAASTSGSEFDDTDGNRIVDSNGNYLKVIGEVLKVSFVLTSGGPSDLFRVFIWGR